MTEQRVRRPELIALILSGVFPGLGQLYTRQRRKGAAFLAAGVVLSVFLGQAVPTVPLTLIQPKADLLAPLCVLLIVWLWSIIDAWRVADARLGARLALAQAPITVSQRRKINGEKSSHGPGGSRQPDREQPAEQRGHGG